LTSTRLQSVVIVAVVALALGLAVLAPSGGSGTSSSGSGSSTTVTALGSNGLRLDLSVNSTVIPHGGRAGVEISEFNTLDSQNNVSQSSDWVVSGTLGACGDGVYPFGVSAYAGHVGLNNVSDAVPLRVFPMTPCPLLLRLVTGYLFEPASTNATILPSSGSNPVPMEGMVSIGEDYTDAGQGHPLAAGVYTIVASDEWGSTSFLYVTFG
jgi:hypothetical protein